MRGRGLVDCEKTVAIINSVPESKNPVSRPGDAVEDAWSIRFLAKDLRRA